MSTRREHFAEHEEIVAQIEEGFAALQIAALTITGSVTSDGDEGISGNYTNPTRITVKNGIVTRIDVA